MRCAGWRIPVRPGAGRRTTCHRGTSFTNRPALGGCRRLRGVRCRPAAALAHSGGPLGPTECGDPGQPHAAIDARKWRAGRLQWPQAPPQLQAACCRRYPSPPARAARYARRRTGPRPSRRPGGCRARVHRRQRRTGPRRLRLPWATTRCRRCRPGYPLGGRQAAPKPNAASSCCRGAGSLNATSPGPRAFGSSLATMSVCRQC